MNPHYSSEMKDRALREYFELLQEAHRDFDEMLDELKRKALDFSDGSQQRFTLALIACDRARDRVWYLEQRRSEYE